MFETWEATKNVTGSCQKARVSRGLFYYWKARFEAKSYPGLEYYEKPNPKNSNAKEETIVQEVIEMKEAHPDWGKKRIAQEIAKANNWVPLVSHNTVKRILAEKGLWPKGQDGGEK